MALASRLRAAGGDALHVYDPRYLHVTVASPVVFFSATKAYPDDKSRSELTAAVTAAMDDECTGASGFFPRAVRATAVRVERREKAVIVLYDDPVGAVERARDCVERLRTREELGRLGLFDGAAGGFKMPRRIVHTTVARFVAPPAEPGSAEEAEWCRAIDEACAAWRPVEVPVEEVRLVRESLPYMHVDIVAETVWRRDIGERAAEE